MSGPADLYGRYARCYDEDRPADFAALFTADGVFLTSGVERARGRGAIEETARAGRASLPGVRHLVSSVDVDVTGDRATGSAYVQAVQIADDGIRLVTMGTYTDEFVLVAGRWLIARHDYTPAIPAGLRGALLTGPPAGRVDRSSTGGPAD